VPVRPIVGAIRSPVGHRPARGHQRGSPSLTIRLTSSGASEDPDARGRADPSCIGLVGAHPPDPRGAIRDFHGVGVRGLDG
jgi:hypothetical protein